MSARVIKRGRWLQLRLCLLILHILVHSPCLGNARRAFGRQLDLMEEEEEIMPPNMLWLNDEREDTHIDVDSQPREFDDVKPRSVDDKDKGHTSLSVTEKNLVSQHVSPESILKEHSSWHNRVQLKRFRGEALGFVTPWHGRGYDFARLFRSKLDYVSPTWYQIKGRSVGVGGGGFWLAGGHDYDGPWVEDVRNGVMKCNFKEDECWETKIVPRVVLELDHAGGAPQLTMADLQRMGTLLADEALDKGYHGFVLDIPLSNGIDAFLQAIHTMSKDRGIELLLIQAVRPGTQISNSQFKKAAGMIHRFSLMTYDYAAYVGNGRGVPNAPFEWVKEAVLTLAGDDQGMLTKILLGIPFYGYDNGEVVNYHNALSLLAGDEGVDKEAPTITWDSSSREHLFEYWGKDGVVHRASYPTLKFIEERMILAQELGVGISVWELGQGMPYFFDLF